MNVSIKDLLFITKYDSDGNYLFWPDLTRAHYSNIVQERLNEKNTPFVSRIDYPPNVPQAHPIEIMWTELERKVYQKQFGSKKY
jgi:hypothetical protein